MGTACKVLILLEVRQGTLDLVGDGITLADICCVAEWIQFSQTRRGERAITRHGLEPLAGKALEEAYPRAAAHARRCAALREFAPDLGAHLRRLDESVLRGRGSP